jgi:hypothetical protein
MKSHACRPVNPKSTKFVNEITWYRCLWCSWWVFTRSISQVWLWCPFGLFAYVHPTTTSRTMKIFHFTRRALRSLCAHRLTRHWTDEQQVGNLLSLASKLRALAKICFKLLKWAKTSFWASRLGRKLWMCKNLSSFI